MEPGSIGMWVDSDTGQLIRVEDLTRGQLLEVVRTLAEERASLMDSNRELSELIPRPHLWPELLSRWKRLAK